MDFIGGRYYKINKFLLHSLGLWSSQTTKRIQIQPIFIYLLFFSFIFAQVNQSFLFKHVGFKKNYISESLIIWNCYYLQLCALITIKYDMELILTLFSHLMPVLIYTTEYIAYYINAKEVSCISHHIDSIISDLNF